MHPITVHARCLSALSSPSSPCMPRLPVRRSRFASHLIVTSARPCDAVGISATLIFFDLRSSCMPYSACYALTLATCCYSPYGAVPSCMPLYYCSFVHDMCSSLRIAFLLVYIPPTPHCLHLSCICYILPFPGGLWRSCVLAWFMCHRCPRP